MNDATQLHMSAASTLLSPVATDCAGWDFWATDRGVRDLVALYLDAGIHTKLAAHFARLGRLAGGRLDELARIADRNGPVLRPRDRFGRDEDWIEYHPAYREMEEIAFGDFQFHAMVHRAGVLGLDRPMPAVAKYAFQYLFVQGEFGIMCPISVSDTSIHLIRRYGSEDLKAYLLPKMLSGDLATLWKAFWANEILPSELVEIYTTPYVKVETEGAHTHYGHGLWINAATNGEREVYIMGGDAGVDFKSSVMRTSDRQLTVISNTSNGTWPLLRDIERALGR